MTVLDIVRPVGPGGALPGFDWMYYTPLLFIIKHTAVLYKIQDHAMRELFGKSTPEGLGREIQMLG